MAWTAPPVDIVEPPYVAAERAALEGWLEFHRSVLLSKCAGLTGEQLCSRSVEPSSLSLLGLVRHMTEVERVWFRKRLIGEDVGHLYCGPDGLNDNDFDLVDGANAEADFAAFVGELELARMAAASKSLDDTFVNPRNQVDIDLRWVYVHMIEEYARHNGHADLIRERIDGVVEL